MTQGAEQDQRVTRVAACACGALRVTTTCEPAVVNACSCFDCQKQTGSAFSYTAFFPEASTKVEGEPHRWRETRASGRWRDSFFCPACGVNVFARLEVLPDLIGVSVGCFADPGFAAPQGFYWSSRRHHWLTIPAGIELLDTQ